jgi:molybdopterin-guanine dinucleotide biosynthesis protein A
MNFSAVLLCGGESRRMGIDKATLRWRGRPLWEWQLETLRALEADEIFVSARTEQPWRPPTARLVLDGDVSRGPLSGLTAALRQCESSHLIALAIDLPFVTSSYLNSLCAFAAPGVGVVAINGTRAEPLAAIYPRESLAYLEAAVNSTRHALQPLINDLLARKLLRGVEVPPEERALFHNINEPADLEVA